MNAYRREQAQEQLSQVGTPITGLIDRETESRPDQLIKAKDLKRPSPNNINPATYQSKQQAEADGFDQGDWYDEKDDGMDPMVANALVEEGGYQVDED